MKFKVVTPGRCVISGCPNESGSSDLLFCKEHGIKAAPRKTLWDFIVGAFWCLVDVVDVMTDEDWYE